VIKIRRITEAGDQLVTCTLEALTPALLFPPYYPLITILPSGRTTLTVEEVLEEARKEDKRGTETPTFHPEDSGRPPLRENPSGG